MYDAAKGLRIALFAEGSWGVPGRLGTAMDRIWNGHLGAALGLPPLAPIVPISKAALVALDPEKPRWVGASEALDQMIARYLRRDEFDAAVVAWDLVPKWDTMPALCRWNETLELYRLLAQSAHLPEEWRALAQTRHEELSQRVNPSERLVLPSPSKGTILALCMEPMFESILVSNEAAVRRALGVSGSHVASWPAHGWGNTGELRPDLRLIIPAVKAAIASIGRRSPQFRGMTGTPRTDKEGWNEFLLARLLGDAAARDIVLTHPIARRLLEVLK